MSILVVAAHPDDEVLGCGGTIRRHTQEGKRVDILFICDGVGARPGAGASERDARRMAAREAARILGAEEPKFMDFADNQLDTVPFLRVVRAIEEMVFAVRPCVVYTHHSGDLNIDHALVSRAALTACRPQPHTNVQSIYAFEVASSTEWSEPRQAAAFTPQRFVDMDRYLADKLKALEAYAEELRPFPHPRSPEAVTALARWRGACAGLHAAEAFELLRSVER